ncbi:ABC transporter C family member 10 isoform X2 [Lolium perenne]|uniref:ABC transporter C family member 10 isoform X2 n=1 Tax=Lolium perenne TaxID=4522 RepID=UPI0021F5748D|nr:ABC transporter C family member 10-like isoform X2 [Lolium perenne]
MATATSAAFSSTAIPRPRRRSIPAATFRSSSPCLIPSRLLRPVFLYSPRAIPLQQQQRRRRGRRDPRLGSFPALLSGAEERDGFGCYEAGRSETPFSAAGFFGRLAFSWLDPLITTTNAPHAAGDVPNLGAADRADTQYTAFSSALAAAATSIHDHHHPRPAAILRAIVSCHSAEIAASALYALLKVLALSAGPPLLKAFVHASASSPPAARRERCCLLALALFLAKCVESVSQRQWYFRSRRAGIQVTSLLSAAIYRKQQRLPPSPATTNHSPGQILSYLAVDARRIGDLFPFRLHQAWATVLQLAVALAVLHDAVGAAAIASVAVILLTVAVNAPLARHQQSVQSELMRAQDMRLNAVSESIANMKALKVYAWENHFREVIRGLRESELRWLSAFQTGRAYTSVVFWASPALVSAATFTACWFLRIPLDANNVFAFVAALRLVQDPINRMPDVIGAIIQGRASLSRIAEFLGVPELQDVRHGQERSGEHGQCYVLIRSGNFSWENNSDRPSLRNIDLEVKSGEKVAICGEVGSGKSTLLGAIFGDVPRTEGKIEVCGKIAYVSQNAWIQKGTVRDNILFGSTMDMQRYEEALHRCSLIKDLEMLPSGDLTQIGEKGVNLSGGQKQRVQLARALYQDADVYLLDDPFSSVDVHTATSLFNDYVIGGLARKTVVLITHKVEFLPAFDSIQLMCDGEIKLAGSYKELLSTSKEFRELVHAHKDGANFSNVMSMANDERTNGKPTAKISCIHISSREDEAMKHSEEDQLMKREDEEIGYTSLGPYLQYLFQNKGYVYASLVAVTNLLFISGQVAQNSWLAANVQNPHVSTLRLATVYVAIGAGSIIFLLLRALAAVGLGLQTSESLFSNLLTTLFRAPISFFDSTPRGRLLSRVSSDLSIIDLDIPFSFAFSISATMNAYGNLGVLVFATWQVLLVSVPVLLLAAKLQRLYLTFAKEMMMINGTTKSLIANHLGESISGASVIRAFGQEDRFFAKMLELVDNNASPCFHNFAATEWLTLRLEIMSAAILSSSAFAIALLPQGTFTAGTVGMVLSYGLSLNMLLVFSVQSQCSLANQIVSVERFSQYMNAAKEAPDIIEDNRPPDCWPATD